MNLHKMDGVHPSFHRPGPFHPWLPRLRHRFLQQVANSIFPCSLFYRTLLYTKDKKGDVHSFIRGWQQTAPGRVGYTLICDGYWWEAGEVLLFLSPTLATDGMRAKGEIIESFGAAFASR
ncbi:hypothetical protein ElyMa_005851200 [Elysia marginata]|uniref:Amine oxidase domain-containing protein n=1 Tax=Elysia marginata TaxID=1093978 RepID=A0AAV4G0I2_9GAST|nr:hypothetical protein ElyMa_005851200 [Elysia marginata]